MKTACIDNAAHAVELMSLAHDLLIYANDSMAVAADNKHENMELGQAVWLNTGDQNALCDLIRNSIARIRSALDRTELMARKGRQIKMKQRLCVMTNEVMEYYVRDGLRDHAKDPADNESLNQELYEACERFEDALRTICTKYILEEEE